jgi:starch phosphorylase
MRWSWNHATDKCGGSSIPELWEITHNPWVVLQTVSRDQIKRVLADPVFRKEVDDLLKTRKRKRRRPPRGFSRIIRRIPSPASPISAWNSC